LWEVGTYSLAIQSDFTISGSARFRPFMDVLDVSRLSFSAAASSWVLLTIPTIPTILAITTEDIQRRLLS